MCIRDRPLEFLDGQSHEIAIYAKDASGVASTQLLSDVSTTLVLHQPNVMVGDINRDGFVDADDLNTLATSWQTRGTSWSEGDFNGDGKTDAADLNLLAVNWLQKTEPSTTGVSFEYDSTAVTGIVVDGQSVLGRAVNTGGIYICLLYTSPSPRDATLSRMPSSA